MAPLYKRYIPPKAGAANGQVAQAAASPSPPQPLPKKAVPKTVQHEEPQKRKRERTDEEVAERKAKKLRSKGIDPATVDLSAKAPAHETASGSSKKGETDDVDGAKEAPLDNGTVPSQGDFGHIKDKRKRHKMEKEARKARIAAEKQAKAGSPDEVADASVPEPEDGTNAVGGHAILQDPDIGEEGVMDHVSVVQEEAQAPPKRKKRRKDQGDGEAQTTPPVEPRTGEQKSQSTEDEPSVLPDQRPAPADIQTEKQQYDAGQPQPKKRRHKLEAVLEQSNNEPYADNDDDNEHLKKHGSILGKFQKSQMADKANTSTSAVDEEQPQAPEPVLRDLVPLPQPEKAPTPEFRPDPNALPSWLAKPTVVGDDKKGTFAELGLDTRLAQHLSKLGFNDALPVQQALIPLLLAPGIAGARYLPGTESVLPDVAVGAPTGSGKTIAYLLPIIEGLKRLAGSGQLKALVVVPTRELVMQVAAVAESLAKGSRVKVGVATGSGSFGDEQGRLIKRGRRCDVEKYRSILAKACRLNYPPQEHTSSKQVGGRPTEAQLDANEDFEDYLDELESLSTKEQQLINDTVSEIDGHVPTYESAVDMLVATPGRLLEHLDNTLGFNLARIEWLVLDEADKLLDGQYSNFLQIITSELQRPHSDEEQDARERFLRSNGMWREDDERRVRKVVLSATMTRDISKLVDLRLRRPQMVLVRGKDDAGQQGDGQLQEAGEGFELPPTLREYSVHVGDGSEKPLFLLRVLREHILSGTNTTAPTADRKATSDSDVEDADAESSSDPDDSSDSSDSGFDTSGTSDSDSEKSANDNDDDVDIGEPTPAPANLDTIHPSRSAALEHHSTTPTVLIFTSSTESASRLSHILSTLATTAKSLPITPSNIITLTSATTPTHLTRTLSSFPADQPVIAITTDRASRGLDALGSRHVTHVVQYDVPRSATNYVHRVGRTARAGRAGEAWTLFTHSEARWFVQEVVRGKGVRRVGGVEKVKVEVADEGAREAFKAAVEGLREGVLRKQGAKGR